MRKIDFEAIRERWATDGEQSDMGLWWLADDLREVLGDEAPEEEVRTATLEALRPLLESGRLRAVRLLEGGDFEVWPGDAYQQLNRMAQEWKAVGRPTLGDDVVWLIGPRGASSS